MDRVRDQEEETCAERFCLEISGRSARRQVPVTGLWGSRRLEKLKRPSVLAEAQAPRGKLHIPLSVAIYEQLPKHCSRHVNAAGNKVPEASLQV